MNLCNADGNRNAEFLHVFTLSKIFFILGREWIQTKGRKVYHWGRVMGGFKGQTLNKL